MRVKTLQENFDKALSLCLRFVSARAQLPILNNVLLKASKNRLIIAATNLEISVSITIGAQIEKEGEVTVPAKVISELIANLPPGTISLEVEKEQLKIKTSSFSSSVLGMNSSDFPVVPQEIPTKNTVFLPKESLSSALSLTLFASSIDETRPILTGVLFIFEKGKLTVVATDGFRLSQKTVEMKSLTKSAKMILPKGVLVELSKSVENEGDFILGFSQGEKQVLFATDNTVFSSRIIEGEFPGFEKIIPKAWTTKVSVDKEDFTRAVKLASVFAKESANVVKLKVEKNAVLIFAESSSAGNQETKIEAKTEGEGVEIAFNFRFLEDLLRSLKSEEVVISLSGASSPAVFTDPKDATFLHLIMPVKIQS